jgi:HPt (histidine-containing phosphotransfer) domain-containing protein
MNTQQTSTTNKKNPQKTTAATETAAQARAESPVDSHQDTTVQPVIDAKTFEQLRLMLGQDTPQMLAGLIENYLESAPELLESLRQALEQGEDQWPQIVHTLKSNSIAFGAVRLCAICEELEANASREDALAKLPQIEAEYERVEDALKAEWHRLYELRLKTDIFFPTGSYKNIGFYPKSTRDPSPNHRTQSR